MSDLELQLSTLSCVGSLMLPGDFQVQTCMKDSDIVKVNVALVCFFMLFWHKR